MATAPLQPARGQRLRSAGVGANTLSPEKLLKGIDEGKGRLKIKSGHVRFETKGESVDSKPPPPHSSPALEREGAWMGWTGRGYPVASFPQNSNSCEHFMLIWFVLTGSLVLRVCLGYRISSSPQRSLLSVRTAFIISIKAFLGFSRHSGWVCILLALCLPCSHNEDKTHSAGWTNCPLIAL